eukprot:44055-Eustigmatos_ZCMA.PRE.1
MLVMTWRPMLGTVFHEMAAECVLMLLMACERHIEALLTKRIEGEQEREKVDVNDEGAAVATLRKCMPRCFMGHDQQYVAH